MTSQPRRMSTRSSSVLALTGLIFLGAGAAVWFLLLPTKTTAQMTLHVAPMSPRLLFEENENAQAQNNIFLRNQAVLLRDRFTITAALRDPGIANLPTIKEQADPEQWIESNLVIEFPSPEFIYISLSGDRPDDLKKIVAAVTKAYMDEYVNKDQIDREQQLRKIADLRQEYQQRLYEHKKKLRVIRELAGVDDRNKASLVGRIASEELRSIEKDLAQLRRELRHLRVELSLHPDWFDEVWPRYVAALNCQPGPGLPVNHVLVALLHDDAHLLPEAAQGDRPQKKERLQHLLAMELAFLREAERLNNQLNQSLGDSDELSQLQKDIDEANKFVQMLGDKLFKLEVEREAPPRISQPHSEAILINPDATKRKMVTGAAATLAGLGILLLGLAGIKFGYKLRATSPGP